METKKNVIETRKQLFIPNFILYQKLLLKCQNIDIVVNSTASDLPTDPIVSNIGTVTYNTYGLTKYLGEVLSELSQLDCIIRNRK